MVARVRVDVVALRWRKDEDAFAADELREKLSPPTLEGWSFSRATLEQGASTTLYCSLMPHEALDGAFFSDCKSAATSPLVTDDACEALWELSRELCAHHLH